MKFANPQKKPRVISSTKGHSIRFPGKGSVPKSDATEHMVVTDDGLVFVHVPPMMVPDARRGGMIPDEDIEAPDKPTGPVKPDAPEELQNAVFAAMRQLVADPKRDDFGANGAPKAKALEKILGWDLNNADLKDYWNKFQAFGKDAE